MIFITQIIQYLLSKSSKFQWICFTLMSCIITLHIAWQQYSQFTAMHKRLQQQHNDQVTKNARLASQLKQLQDQDNATIESLSNADIVDTLENWSTHTDATIISINFSEERYNDSLNIVRTHVDSVATMQSIYALLDSVIGQGIFIHSIVIKNHTPTTIELRLQLVRPMKKQT